MSTFLHVWLLGIVNPAEAFDELKNKPAPQWGLWATLIRWLGQALTSGLLAFVLGKHPATPQRLIVPFLADENYHAVALLFTPFFGLGIWILWSGMTHVMLRLAGQISDIDQILNIIGLSSLIPAPFVWIWDSSMIALNRLFAPEAGVAHVILALWGLFLLGLGFRRNLKVPIQGSIALPVILFVVYVPLAMLWIR